MSRLRVLCYHDSYDDYVGALVNGVASHAEVWLAHPSSSSDYLRPMVREDVHLLPIALPRLRDPRRMRAVPVLGRLAASVGADVVHVQQSADPWFNVRNARSFGVARVDTIHDVTPHPGDRTAVPGGGATHRLARRSIARYIAHAPVLRDDLVAHWKIDPSLVDVVPMGELGSVYGGRLPGREPTLPAQVLFFGRIWPYKGLDRLVLAMNELSRTRPGLTLVIAGAGESIDRYVALARPELTLDVRNRRVGDDEVREIFTAATVACFPYIEASQSAALAVAFGFDLPVVATRVGGLSHAVADGIDGLLVAPDDVVALSAALARVLDDVSLREALRRGVAERNALERNWTDIGAQTVDVYQRAIAEDAAG